MSIFIGVKILYMHPVLAKHVIFLLAVKYKLSHVQSHLLIIALKCHPKQNHT